MEFVQGEEIKDDDREETPEDEEREEEEEEGDEDVEEIEEDREDSLEKTIKVSYWSFTILLGGGGIGWDN